MTGGAVEKLLLISDFGVIFFQIRNRNHLARIEEFFGVKSLLQSALGG